MFFFFSQMTTAKITLIRLLKVVETMVSVDFLKALTIPDFQFDCKGENQDILPNL